MWDYHPTNISWDKRKAHRDICNCRTPNLGGFILKCDDCGKEEHRYRSCGNRNCPICQGMKQHIWVENRKAEALTVPYFHMVFTVPDVLNRIFLSDPEEMYNILFRSSSETLMQFGNDPKWIGGKLGFISILHTWGSNLSLHPHMHVILIGCGIRGNKLIQPKHDVYLFPVKALGKVFREKFLDLMRKASLEIPAGVYANDWVVYNKETDTGDHIISYLGRYTHRVAISDARIVDTAESTVTFSYKDYRDGMVKNMTLSKNEFCRRFLLHVLPKGFRKIRFYGFLANRNKSRMLRMIRRLLNAPLPVNRLKGKSRIEIFTILYGPNICPCCGSKRISRIDMKPRHYLIA